MGIKSFKIIFIALIIFYSSCNNKEEQPYVIQPNFDYENVENEKIKVNREIVRRENEDIKLIAKRYNWNLNKTETGLHYMILNQTKGKYPQKKDIVNIKGTIELRDGKEIFNSKTDGIKQFTVDMSEEPVGLHELVKLMRTGEKSNAIIPSYLAYGISGNGTNIPAVSSLICKIELISIN